MSRAEMLARMGGGQGPRLESMLPFRPWASWQCILLKGSMTPGIQQRDALPLFVPT